jgi:phosphoribosyl 1,2-cyclic phosphate phosphodiesterase
MKKTEIILLGCGSSLGVPRIDGYWGEVNKKNKKNHRMRCSLFIKYKIKYNN